MPDDPTTMTDEEHEAICARIQEALHADDRSFDMVAETDRLFAAGRVSRVDVDFAAYWAQRPVAPE